LAVRELLGVLLCLGVVGCGKASVDSLTRTADSMRDATERLAANSKARSDAREQEIIAAGLELQRAAEAPGEASARYELRRTGGGWGVYDLATGKLARWRNTDQENLTRERASVVMSRLQFENDQGFPGPGGRR
jgi:hypothetical protein